MAIFQKPFSGSHMIEEGSSGTALQLISERHVACVFLLDTSASMEDGDAIGQLNDGIKAFKNQTMDAHTKACIDVAMITFGGDVNVVQDFCPASEMSVPTLTADGDTPMGEALNLALDMIAEQKEKYNTYGTPYFRPWVFCITDGEPTDDYAQAAERLNQLERATKVLGYCTGVRGFNKQKMKEIFNAERIYELDNCDFTSLFQFVSSSLAAVRNSDPDGGRTIDVEAPHTLKIAF